jgi:undecaprenyl-diphosphatase
VIFELAGDLAKMALIVAGLYLAFGAYVHRRRQAWVAPMAKRRFTILLGLVLLVCALKVGEDVHGGESGPVDRSILVFIHSHVPGALTRFFEAVTVSGSALVLFPLTLAGVVGLLCARRRPEALLLAGSVAGGELLVFLLKTAVGRVRPDLWHTATYWGSSFPSGHTLVTAAFATAAVLCVDRIRPAARVFTLPAALAWIILVACSRLVLGVHWPTDVLAATCIGAFLPLAVCVALEFRT